MNDAAVLYTVEDHIAYVTLNQPEKRNSFTDIQLFALLEVLEKARSNPEIRVLVLTGAGKSFSVGGDLDEFAAGALHEDAPFETGVYKLRRFMQITEMLRESNFISIAAVNGACAGAGLSIALACDIRVSSEKAVYRTAFIDAGLSGDFGGTWLLARLLGEAKAKELYLLNKKLNAADAAAAGLVSEVYAVDEFETKTRETAQTLAAKAPLAMRYIKQNLTEEKTFMRALDDEARRHTECGVTGDAIEAAAAFLEKRAPKFTGK